MKITLREAYAKATPGPLVVSRVFGIGQTIADSKDENPVCFCDCVKQPNEANAALLAHAFNVLPDVVKELERAIHDLETGTTVSMATRQFMREALARANQVEIP